MKKNTMLLLAGVALFFILVVALINFVVKQAEREPAAPTTAERIETPEEPEARPAPARPPEEVSDPQPQTGPMLM